MEAQVAAQASLATHALQVAQAAQAVEVATDASQENAQAESAAEEEIARRRKALCKKLKMIGEIKERRANGRPLEATQLLKLSTEAGLREQLRSLEPGYISFAHANAASVAYDDAEEAETEAKKMSQGSSERQRDGGVDSHRSSTFAAESLREPQRSKKMGKRQRETEPDGRETMSSEDVLAVPLTKKGKPIKAVATKKGTNKSGTATSGMAADGLMAHFAGVPSLYK